MIYYISMLSTTGGKLKVSPKKILEKYNKIKKLNNSKMLLLVLELQKKPSNLLKKLMVWWLVVQFARKSLNQLKRDKMLSQMLLISLRD